MTSFFLQLKIILWKNVTLKRRSLFFLIELLLPLTLFIILYLIRKEQPPDPRNESKDMARPLPSSGVIPIMQAFCPISRRDGNGFPYFPGASVDAYLSNLQELGKDNNFFEPSFAPSDLDKLPDIYKTIIEDPAAVHDVFFKAKDIQVQSLFTNQSSLMSTLEANYSLSDEDLKVLYHSTVNFTEVYLLLFNYSQTIPLPFNESPFTLPIRGKRSPNPKDPSSANQVQYSLSHDQGLANQYLPFLSHDKDWAKHEVVGKDFGSFNDEKKKGELVYTIVKEDPELATDPDVIRLLNDMSGMNGNVVVPTSLVLNVMKKVVLSPVGLHTLICEMKAIDQILVPPTPNDTASLKHLECQVCKLNQSEWNKLSWLLLNQSNTAYISQQLDLDGVNVSVTGGKVKDFAVKLHEFMLFEDIIQRLSRMAASLPQDQCLNSTTSTAPEKTNGSMTDNDEETKKDSSHKVSVEEQVEQHRRAKYGALMEIWMSMQEVLCGKRIVTKESLSQYTKTGNIGDLGFNNKELEEIGILLHILYSSPKILYAPNNTQVDQVIHKANSTLALLDTISQYAQKWLNVSAAIKDYLNQPETEAHLSDIRQMQSSLQELPQLAGLKSIPEVQNFMYNTTVYDADFLLAQLDTVDTAACSWLKLIDGISLNVYKGFGTEEEAIHYFLHNAYHDQVTVLATVVFTNVQSNGTLPPNVEYKIRQNSSFTPKTNMVRNKIWMPSKPDGKMLYYTYGFVWIQDVIERAIMSLVTGRDVHEPATWIQSMPYPCYLMDHFLFMIEHVMPLCLTISWVYTVAMLVQGIVYEKEQRLREVMRMMGLRGAVHWLAWFITSFAQMTLIMIILTVILKYGGILKHSNVWLIFLALEIFATATIALSFLISSFYSKAKVAAACAGIIYFITYVPYMYVAIREEAANQKIPVWAKGIASLSSTTAFGLGSKYFALYEIQGTGVQWDNLGQSPVEGDVFCLLDILLMMCIDTCIYLLLTCYIENVHPGSYGLPKPWYFPFTTTYWLGQPVTTDIHCCPRPWTNCRKQPYELSVMEDDQACALQDRTESSHFEPEPEHLPKGVSISNLTKVYKNGKLAVNKLSLNLYEGQVTSFLGHNGAGKTTTMSILTGLFPASGGYATIYNHDIRTDMNAIRKSLGMCPQHNVLFDKLTVDEHLWFYSRLKGVATKEIAVETQQLLEDMDLVKKKRVTVDCLSGGMQRKLSVAIAFVAGSKTVILDEPTAGVDPYARRQIWDLLVKYKKGRTILLSTHHMDEADILGDRIAIISGGQLQCCGSPLYLKSHFGEGYHLIVVKKPSEEDIISKDTLCSDDGSVPFHTRCNSDKLTEFIVKHVGSAYLKSESTQEAHYILPFDEAKKGNFERLFQALDSSLNILYVSSYGVVDTSLEEVFLKVTAKSLTSPDQEMMNLDKLEELNNSNDLAYLDDLNCDLQPVPVTLPTGTTVSCMTLSSHGSTSDTTALLRGHRRSPSTGANNRSKKAHQQHKRSPSDTTPTHTYSSTHVVAPPTGEGHVGTHRGHMRTPSDFSLGTLASIRGSYTTHRRMGSDMSARNPLIASPIHSLTNIPTSQQVNIDMQPLAPATVEERAVVPAEGGRGSYSVTGTPLLITQFVAVIIKRFLYIRRNWRQLFSQILLPAMFVCIAMTVALTAPQVKDLPPIVLSPAQYYNYTQPIGHFVPYTVSDGQPAKWSRDASTKAIVYTFKLPSGLGATCLLKSPFNSSFDLALLKQLNHTTQEYTLLDSYYLPRCRDVFAGALPLKNFVPPLHQDSGVDSGNITGTASTTPKPQQGPNYYPQCHCLKEGSLQVCNSDYTSPPQYETVSSDRMLDISLNQAKEEDYYLATTDIYRLHRYGGFAFGLSYNGVPVEFGQTAPSEFRKIGIRNVAKVWFNDKGYHSLPTFINSLNNAILRANLPLSKGNPAAYGITAINHPMNSTNNVLSLDFIQQGSDVLIAIFIICAMSFVPASFVVFLVYEKSIKAKHLQFASGANKVVYWLANYVWDMFNYLVPAFCCIIILRGFNIPTYVSSTNFPAVVSLFLLYGWSITPMMYPASFYFQEPSSAYIVLIVANLFIGITCIITSFLLEMFQQGDPTLTSIHNVLKNVFLVFPNYCLGRGLMDVAFNEYKNQYYFKAGMYSMMRSPFQWEIVSRNLVAMASMGFLFFIITVLCEYKFFIPSRKRKSSLPDITDEDEDVQTERKRVTRGSGRKDLLRLEGLTKVYQTRKLGSHLAVDRLTLGVPQGECFGLLGVNGAGKTTTFKMLTGDISPTHGNASLNGFSLSHDLSSVQASMGYCPQFDALYDELTAREHLLLYARLKGIPCKEQSKVVNWALDKLSLTQYADQQSGTFSGGNKRKLSTAIALLGHPPVIFLDEPTTGMDPHSRRFLWDLILDLIAEGRSVVLTSHSMEECEALCTRLAIMVNGRFRCLGSVQHLKNKFGEGYTLCIRVKGPHYDVEVRAVKHFIARNFVTAQLKDCHHNLLQYELHGADVSLSQLFHKMEDAEKDLHIEDYSISQNTLDNVFINFVKQQQELIPELSVSNPPTATQAPPTRTRAIGPEQEAELVELIDDDEDVVLRNIGRLELLHIEEDPVC